ncbi:DNA-processing protein DprA [Sulfobacillus thermosulfidooxidans]|uniref:DNA-processing protein DprA n=1 Tax=Sulfobacillus thermosulfidooxidans TaxID=28034 RepID=UPI0002E09962|nr:DNA-processing protein DprA [Sulfobacillus thermosulfidooxidans]
MGSASQERAIRYFTLLSLLGNTRQARELIDLREEYRNFVLAGTVSDLLTKTVGLNTLRSTQSKVTSAFKQLKHYYIVEHGSAEYPALLTQIHNPPRFLFLQGDVSLLAQPIVSIVGTRNASDLGRWRAGKLAALLSRRGIVVASGLAKGIDAAAHHGTLLAQGRTIAVLGTPLNQVYPPENAELQDQIAIEGLLVSQFAPSMAVHRYNFPQRNATMSGISVATVVIEAGETSGALIQADYAIKQGRIVFIPQSAVDNDNLQWPKKFLARSRNAFKFSTIEEVDKVLATTLQNFDRSASSVRVTQVSE